MIPEPLANSGLLKSTLWVAGGRAFLSGLRMLMVMVAARTLGLSLLGLVFFAEATMVPLLLFVDLGLYSALMRRAARGEHDLPTFTSTLRARTVALLTSGIAVTILLQGPLGSGALVFLGLFVARGMLSLAALGRSVLYGRERFALDAYFVVGSGVVGAAFAMTGMLAGWGLPAWIIGMILTQLLYMLFSLRFALHQTGREAIIVRGIFAESLPFWLRTVLAAVQTRVNLWAVTAWLGYGAAGSFGVATRLITTPLFLVNSLAAVAFPRWTKDRRRTVPKQHAMGIALLALAMGAGLFAFAPLLVAIIVGAPSPSIVLLVRLLTPSLLMMALRTPMMTWLQAKDLERPLALLSVIHLIASLGLLAYFFPRYGAVGAAVTYDLQAAFELVTCGLLIYLVVRRKHVPFTYLQAMLPGGRARVVRALGTRVRELADKLHRIPGVVGVEQTGSSCEPREFVPGESDIDLVVAADGTPLDLSRIQGMCRAAARWRCLPGPLRLTIANSDLLWAARRLGRPTFITPPRNTLTGQVPRPVVADLRAAREWGIQHALQVITELQAMAIERSASDGSLPRRPLLAACRNLVWDLGVFGTDAAAALAIFKADEHRGHISAEGVATLLQWSIETVEHACREVTHQWQRADGPTPPSNRRGQERVASIELSGRIVQLCRDCGTSAVALTPCGPHAEDALLLALLPDRRHAGAVEFWCEWVRTWASMPALPSPPFRPIRYPLALSRGIWEADALWEHPPLLHLARTASGTTLAGDPPAALRPPESYLQRAALRSTIRFLMAMPALVVELQRRPERVHGRVLRWCDAQLPALSLLLDHGRAPATAAQIRANYVARYDDPLAAILRQGEQLGGASFRRIGEALSTWGEERMKVVARLVA